MARGRGAGSSCVWRSSSGIQHSHILKNVRMLEGGKGMVSRLLTPFFSCSSIKMLDSVAPEEQPWIKVSHLHTISP